VLGVDGGGTKTLVVCVNKDKNVVGQFTSACTNHNSVGPESAHAALRAGIEGALKAAERSVEDVAAITLSMSGVDRPVDKEMVGTWVQEIFPTSVSYAVHNDAAAALASGTQGRLYGIVVISGTGTIAYGYNEKGDSLRAQGWGPLLGDTGSGYDIGLEVLKAVMRAKDGINPPTLLTAAVLSTLGVENEEDLIAWAYNKKDEGWQRIANLAALAHQCARKNDAKSIEIINSAAHSLFVAIQAVAKRLNLPTQGLPLVLAGGNLDHDDSLLAERLVALLHEHCPGVLPTRPIVSPAVGAALLGLKSLEAHSEASK